MRVEPGNPTSATARTQQPQHSCTEAQADTDTTALGGVCPAQPPRGCWCVWCTYAWLPRRGNPWARKALIGAGRTAQSPKPPYRP